MSYEHQIKKLIFLEIFKRYIFRVPQMCASSFQGIRFVCKELIKVRLQLHTSMSVDVKLNFLM